ncbi:formyl-CoA:oxalate CoA-transferase [Azorhizobium oxalatiphilum]|uniref:Formyl-CoA:oxalate CoA-transferase n=1 Tax=Azorhizobium oxalatiphilum TaxID=980631 RepID=A0A917C1K0_9HYPH|nr:formyl-CoA transferase [Azorhizobium oxalatiphilum]GGF65461.1 formyl-CoA:oxalate CoA-transferase [Azorhizobium oxalatiphilum]
MAKALEGVRILDMTHVQSGPSATQLLAWMGADVIKIEMPRRGDITRSQLRDRSNVDSLYFAMLNGNKRSVTLNIKSTQGQDALVRLIERCDVLVENFGPGVLERQGFSYERIAQINPRLIYASIKGFAGVETQDAKAYETIAQAMGGAMSTTGFQSGPPTASSMQVGDTGTGIHCVAGILAALFQRTVTGKGQRVDVAMQDCVVNLLRVKLRDQQRLASGPLVEYPGAPQGEAVPRAGNSSGGGQPGAALRCAPGGENDFCYVIIQPQGWAPLMRLIGRKDLIEDARFASHEARAERLEACFEVIEAWTRKRTKHEVMKALSAIDVPCGPILSTKDIIEDRSLYERGFLVDVPHPERGNYVTVGSPIQLSESAVEVERAPLLGEHTEEVLAWIGFDPDDIASMRASGAA